MGDSDTSSIDHLVTEEFVGRSPRCHLAIKGAHEQFKVLEQSPGLENRVSRTFTTQSFRSAVDVFWGRSSRELKEWWHDEMRAYCLLRLYTTCTCFAYTVTDVDGDPFVKSPLLLLQPVSTCSIWLWHLSFSTATPFSKIFDWVPHCRSVNINMQKKHCVTYETHRQGKRVYRIDINIRNTFDAMSQARDEHASCGRRWLTGADLWQPNSPCGSKRRRKCNNHVWYRCCARKHHVPSTVKHLY